VSQIKWRHVSKEKIKKNGWVIFVEDVQYAAQGQVAGFPIECRTAIHQRLPTGGVVAASECFAYEDRESFLRILGGINFSDYSTKLPSIGVGVPNQVTHDQRGN